MCLMQVDRTVCQTHSEGWQAKWRGLCGCNPAIHILKEVAYTTCPRSDGSRLNVCKNFQPTVNVILKIKNQSTVSEEKSVMNFLFQLVRPPTEATALQTGRLASFDIRNIWIWGGIWTKAYVSRMSLRDCILRMSKLVHGHIQTG
jgi:hypothetical protein